MHQQDSTSCEWPCQDASAPYYFYTDQTCKSFCSDPYQVLQKQYGSTCELALSQDQQKEVEISVSASNIGNVINSITINTVTIISAANSVAVTGGTLVKLLGYTRYLDVSHSATLEAVYANFKAPTGLLASKQLELHHNAKNKFSTKTPPQVFEKYNISPVFLIGFWIGFISLLAISLVVLVIIGVQWKFTKLYKDSTFNPTLQKVKITAQNFLLQQFYSSYGDITMYSMLQFRSAQLSKPASVLSILIATAFLIGGICMLVAHVRLLRRYQQIKRGLTNSNEKSTTELDQFQARYEGIKTLFQDFKDTSFTHQAFLLFFAIRSVITGLCLSLLFEHPLAEAIIMLITSLIILAYIVVLRPFKNMLDNLQQIVFELVLLIVSGSLLIIATLDKENGDHVHRKHKAAQVILFMNTIANYVPLASIAIKAFLLTRDNNSINTTEKAKSINDAGDVEKKAFLNAKEGQTEPRTLQTSIRNFEIETSPNLVTRRMYEEDGDNESPKTLKKLLNDEGDIECMSPTGTNMSPTSRRDNSPFLGGISLRKMQNSNDANARSQMTIVNEDADKNEESKEDQGGNDEENIIIENSKDSIQSLEYIQIHESPTHKEVDENKGFPQDEFDDNMMSNDSKNMDKSPVYVLNPSSSYLHSLAMFGSGKKDVKEEVIDR